MSKNTSLCFLFSYKISQGRRCDILGKTVQIHLALGPKEEYAFEHALIFIDWINPIGKCNFLLRVLPAG